MNNIKPLLKRVGAYVIDLFLVLIISSLLSSIPFLNANKEAYQKTYEEYEKEYNKYTDYLKLLEESYKDKSITEEEYSKLAESTEYQEIIAAEYEDNQISKDEYTEIVKNVNNKFDQIANDYIYILNKKGVSNSIITIVCTLLYFGILQYFLKGQTIGKKIIKLQVVSASDKKINIFNYLLRSLIVNDVLLNTISIIFLVFATKSIYTSANNIISMIISLVEALIIFLVLTREDRRGLHDLLFNTKVISTELSKEKNIEKETIELKTKPKKKIIDAEYTEGNK